MNIEQEIKACGADVAPRITPATGLAVVALRAKTNESLEAKGK